MRNVLAAALIYLGACHAAPPPEPPRNAPSAPPRAAPSFAPLDVTFGRMDGWTQTRAADAMHLQFHGMRADHDLAVGASRARAGEPIAQWNELWTETIAKDHLVTSLAPGPHRARLSSGYPVYWDGGAMTTAQGVEVVAVVYLVVGAERVVPIVGSYRGRAESSGELDLELEQSLEPWFPTIAVAGGPATEPLYTAAELAGTWATPSEELELGAKGTYVSTYHATALGTEYTDTHKGAWSVDDARLVMKDGDRTESRRIWAVGHAPSGEPAIRLAPSYASETNAPLANPRPSDRAGWYLSL